MQYDRNGHDFQVNFMIYNDSIKDNYTSSSSTDKYDNNPIHAMTRLLPSVSRQNRKI